MSKKSSKKTVKSMIRMLFEVIPLPLNYFISIILVLMLVTDISIPDFLPFLDEIILLYLAYQSISVTRQKQRRLDEDTSVDTKSDTGRERESHTYNDRMKTIISLFDDIKKSLIKSRSSTYIKTASKRFDSLLPKIEMVKNKIESMDSILLSSGFGENELESELSQLSRNLSRAETDNERAELKTAREHAEKCLITVKKLKKDRNILTARLEKFYFLLKETHSKIIAMDLSEKNVTEDITQDINQLIEAVDSFDQAMKELDQGTSPLDTALEDLAVSEDVPPPLKETET
ncbi:MAG: hypothetical protein A2161_05990 [Candidatus Schekmanbacteria bacterium RBG_13_48_7]|uniref:Uncharacterized protein n=1 Tax=Candidatus Schekmanbacteria bacterium RBG_13_48_7 TaxID=1817878 RepID=A0A1F7RLR5_9BACT|nr:MAG: hypothetical protein A2161_05990 [Candidatus Schekmanbacteria bacterium RBG_13_48_7]